MSSPQFPTGARVRVRPGVMDPDFPELPLGGWSGVVRERDGPLCLVAWDESAVDADHRARCEREELEWETEWLNEADLEGEADAAERRAREILGVSGELPPTDLDNLDRFHAHLKTVLQCPFPATVEMDTGTRRVLVLRILPPERSLPGIGLMAEIALDERRGEVPLVTITMPPGPATRDLEAYMAWVSARLPPPPKPPSLASHPFVLLGLLMAALGGVTGAAVAAVPGAGLGAMVGAGVFASVGFFLGSRYEVIFRLANRLPPGMFGGAVVGFLGGAGVGAAAGALVVTFVGAIPGAITGTGLSWLLAALDVRRPTTVVMSFVGAMAGSLALAFVVEWPAALEGLGYGLLVGALAGVLLIGGTFAYMTGVFHYSDQ